MTRRVRLAAFLRVLAGRRRRAGPLLMVRAGRRWRRRAVLLVCLGVKPAIGQVPAGLRLRPADGSSGASRHPAGDDDADNRGVGGSHV